MVNSPARRNLSPKEISASGELKTGVVREVEEAPETEEEEEEDAQEEGDEGDEEEDEIEQIIRRSSHFLMDDRTANGGSRRTLPHSCSAHANLNMFKRQERTGLAQHKLEEQTEEGETEDSDEELFAEHSALLPLRKSKSAFAGFHCERIQQSTAPFECPVVVKGTTSAVPEEHQEGNDNQIAELIDLRRGDVLKFRIAHSRSSKGASSSSSSSVSLSVGANERAVSRWSAPACPAGDSEVEWDSEEEHGGEGTEQFWETGDGDYLSTKDRKGSSWSAPSQFWDKLAKQRDKEERKRIREAEEQAHWEGREMDEQGEEGAEKEEEEEGPYYAGLEPQNMRNLEIEEAQPEGEEGMSTSEDDEEDREDEEQNGEDEGEEEHIVVSDLRKHMRVFVSANSHYPAILHRHGAQLPSSRSDSQLLWRRSAAPPPPAPFPLETEKQRAIPHSRTYGGGMGARGDEEEEQEDEEGGEEAAEDKMSQEEQSMSGGLRTEVSRPLQQIVIRPRFRRRYFPGMGNRHSDTSFDRPTRIYLLDGQQDEIPMADDCPSPNPLLGPGLLTLPLRRGAKYAAETALENSPLSSSYYSGEEGDGSGKREGARRALPRRPRITMQRSAAARLCRRGSPPFAQTELLSESEISDLEEQIASGRLVNGASEEGTLRQFLEDGGSREREQEHKDGGETGDGRSVEGDGEGRKQDPPEEAEGTLGKSASICGSCSMPTIHCAPAGGGGYWGSGHAPANFWQSEYPAENEPWEEHLSGANMHRSLTMQGEMEGQLRGGRRRRMLPLRPDQQPRTSAQEAPGAAEQSSECLSPPSEPLLSQSFSAKRRQLPKIPSGEGPLDSIDIASTTKEYLLSVLHRGGGPQQQRRRESGSQMDEQPLEVEEDFSPSGPVLPSPSVVQRPALALAAAFVGPRWGNAAQHQSSSEEYKFSYGLDQSVLRHARKGLSMEDSYYEDVDGLNGNLVGLYDGGARERARGWNREDELYTPDDETERRKVSAYNLADGAKSSSGISSCCTTSSRSCEPAEGHSYQQLLVRRQRQRADALANDPSAPTHRAQFPFMPRHADEMALERGDALHVGEKYEDHWCFGTNLRTGQRGIFPEAHIVEIDLVEEICRSVLPDSVPHQAKQERDTFYLTMLASIEVAHHKGNDVLVQAINKVCSVYQQKEEILVPQTVLMEISFRGIHVIDKRKKDIFRCPTFDYFYSLQNIAFCGAHPKELRYFGFITKHPLLPRFACHVFLSNESTQPIVEAIGRAFKRSYDEYMAFAHPTEDIFID